MTDKQTVTIPAELAIGILNYLRARPYAEVAGGAAQLEMLISEQVGPAEPKAE